MHTVQELQGQKRSRRFWEERDSRKIKTRNNKEKTLEGPYHSTIFIIQLIGNEVKGTVSREI